VAFDGIFKLEQLRIVLQRNSLLPSSRLVFLTIEPEVGQPADRPLQRVKDVAVVRIGADRRRGDEIGGDSPGALGSVIALEKSEPASSSI
jgi:hypothetical protein